MANDPADSFGFELIFKSNSDAICTKDDVLIVFVHWFLVKNGFKCLGVGDSKTIDPAETGSEFLPQKWNQSDNCTLRYIRNNKLFILVGVKLEEDLLLNLMRVEDHFPSNIQFTTSVVQQLQGPLESLIPTYKSLITKLKEDFVDPHTTAVAHEVSTQTQTQERERNLIDDDPLRVGPPRRPLGSRSLGRDPAGILNIGESDLYPLRPGAGGMIFDPFSNQPRPPFPGLGVPGRMPPGAVPPGARFDPFGPPDSNIPYPSARGPDADHMPPPSYEDMFM